MQSARAWHFDAPVVRAGMASPCWVPRLQSEEERLLHRLLRGAFTSRHLPISFPPTLKATDLAADNFKLDYNPALDGLRGVAILLVVLSHAHVPLFDGAFLGVDLFFVLSGFLITSLLLMEQQSNGRLQYWRFYRRRFFRLMPALALFLATYCLLAPLLWPGLDDVRQDALVSLLYLADYGIAFFDSPGTLLHMWSLSVEEHFYLVWPPLLALLLRFSKAGAVWRPLAALYLLSWAWRVVWVVQGQQFYEIFFRFDTRASGLLAGCLLAALMVEKPAFIGWRAHATRAVAGAGSAAADADGLGQPGRSGLGYHGGGAGHAGGAGRRAAAHQLGVRDAECAAAGAAWHPVVWHLPVALPGGALCAR